MQQFLREYWGAPRRYPSIFKEDEFIIAVYCLICEYYQRLFPKGTHRGGFLPKLTDEEALTIAIVGEYLNLMIHCLLRTRLAISAGLVIESISLRAEKTKDITYVTFWTSSGRSRRDTTDTF